MSELVILNIVGFGVAILLLFFVTHQAGSGSTFAHLFSALWGPCILAAQFLTTSTTALSVKTLLVLFAAWWALLAGSLLTIKRRPASAPREVSIYRRRALAAVLLLFSLHATLVVYEMPRVDLKQPTDRFVRTLRNADELSGLRKCPWWLEIFRGAYFVYLPLALMLRKRGWLSSRAFYILILAASLLLLTHMTRVPLLAVVVTLWCSWALLNRPSTLRAWGVLLGGFAAFCAVFLMIQTALASGQTRKSEGVQLVEAYFGGSMQAYESILDGTFPREPGYYSADMFNYALRKVNLMDSYPSIVRPYGNYNTNIYTFLDAFTLDGGIFGAILGATLVGVAGGWLLTKASRYQNPMMVTAYSMFALAMADAIANNDFIRINFVLTIILCAIVNRYVVRRRGSRSVVFIPPSRYLSQDRRSLTAVASGISK